MLNPERVLSRQLIRNTQVGDAYFVLAEGVDEEGQVCTYSVLMPVVGMCDWQEFHVEVDRG